jgi:Tfp pilus assembly protein PilV
MKEKWEVGSLKWEGRSLKGRAAGDRRPDAPLVASDFNLQPSTFKPGFNLVETLAASMILSAAVLTLSAISTNALTSTRLHRHYEQAASVIDQQLTLIDQVGIDQFIEAGQMEGMNDQFEPGYQWVVATEYMGTDNLYAVKITVTWLEGRRPYRVTAQTMLNGASLVTETDTQSGEQPTQR